MIFLAVPRQLYRFPCHSLTDSLTDSLPVLKDTTKEHSERLVTLETCYQSDEETWPDKQKDNDNDNDKDKDKDKDESAENLNMCYIFEKLRIQGYQIW